MIDIIVPTYNRPADVEQFIAEIQQQTFPDYHLYIIDDHGSLPIEHLVPKDSRQFSFIRLDANKGQAYARNVAIEKGRGDIIVSLDDDAWFEQVDGLSHVGEYFRRYPKIGCLMFNVRTPQDDYLSTIHKLEDGQLIGSHITCGCAYSRAALQQVGCFGGWLHSGAEEADVSLKLIAAGYEIRFAKDIPAFHNYIPGKRSDKWYRKLRFNTTRNDMLIAAMRYPAMQALPYFFGKYASHTRYSFRSKRDALMAGLYTLIALPAALLLLPKALQHRKALTNKQFSEWLKIRW